ncbi:unnamed protein product, partial [Symbiodinium microadriaticum]
WAMAIECYYSDKSKVSRIFPIFFGRRADVFGQVGNLFDEEEYLHLPDVVPTASLDLACRLLQEGGIETRPEMKTMTTKGIITQMKGFLTIFAWNIEPCESITSECVNIIQQVLREILTQRTDTVDIDTSARRSTTAAVAAPNFSSGIPLKRCVEILQEALGVESTVAPTALKEALDSLGDDIIRQQCDGMKSLAEKMQYLCSYMGYTE